MQQWRSHMKQLLAAGTKQQRKLLDKLFPPSLGARLDQPVDHPTWSSSTKAPATTTATAAATSTTTTTPPPPTPTPTPPITTPTDPSSKARKEERLADVMWKPQEEFPGATTIQKSRDNLQREGQVLTRIALVTLERIFEPRRLALLGICSSGVLGISAYEASLLLDPSCLSMDASMFIFKYSLDNFFASCIWETKPPELIARSIGCDPAQLLRVFDPTSPSDAATQLHVLGVYTTRSLVAGFMLVAQVFSMVQESMNATKMYHQNVYDGREPLLRGINERIIRLAGDGSDVTEVSMTRYGAHILPVFENAAKHHYLVNKWSLNGRVPCIWQVPSGHYGFRHAWDCLNIDSSYMLRTTTGKMVLCIEADAVAVDSAFDFLESSHDLTLEEASQAFRMIERTAALQKAKLKSFRTLCVFLGDSLHRCEIGGLQTVLLRDRAVLKKEVDVFIDAKAPLLLEILKWCHRFVGIKDGDDGNERDERKTLVLDATPGNYAPLKLLLEKHGYLVLDASVFDQENIAKQAQDAKHKTEKLPRLFYYSTTAATVNAVHSALSSGLVDPRHCCVLINSLFGLAHLKEIAAYEKEDFHPICAAQVYDDYFRQVRIWTRMGHSAAVIQRELDCRFAKLADIQVDIAKSKPMSVERAPKPSEISTPLFSSSPPMPPPLSTPPPSTPPPPVESSTPTATKQSAPGPGPTPEKKPSSPCHPSDKSQHDPRAAAQSTLNQNQGDAPKDPKR